MKTIASLAVTLLATVCGLLLTGCASMDASNQTAMLSASGFVARTPENGKQQELYDALPAYRVHRATYNGKVIYAYKDEKAGLAYVGSEPAYQKYQQLAVQRSIAADNYRAAELNREASYGWYGAYSPYVVRGPVYLRR